MYRIVSLFVLAILGPVLWLLAEWKCRLLYRILAGILLVAAILLCSSFLTAPLHESLAISRHSHYRAAEAMCIHLNEGNVATVTNALHAFMDTENEWDSYPQAAHQLMTTLVDQAGSPLP